RRSRSRDAPRPWLDRRSGPPPAVPRVPPRDETRVPREARLPCGAVRRATAACAGRCSSPLLFGGLQHEAHRARERIPFGALGGQLLAASIGQPVVLRAFALVGQLPGGGN